MHYHIVWCLISACVKPQFSVDLNGPDGTLSLRSRGVDPTADQVSCVFTGEGVEALMDLSWHKVALSVQHGAASLHVDCHSFETKPMEPRGVLPTDGHTLLALRASDAGPVQVRLSGERKYWKCKEILCGLLVKYSVHVCPIFAIEELLNKIKLYNVNVI